ncbi:hypothetical protein EB74_18855 [Mycobacterium sp. SWH-M5]|nr:hypothetical protein EB74_18855 [Mycobacterium sp. SWH-M5]
MRSSYRPAPRTSRHPPGEPARLSAYKVPTRWVIASSDDETPTLPSGKFDRKSLRRWIIDGRLGLTAP